MRFRLLATDFDRTLARWGKVPAVAETAFGRWRAAGGMVAMVTGRELDDIVETYPGLAAFDIVVAENGAVLYWPSTGLERLLGEPPPPEFVAALRRRGVSGLSVGRVIVAARLADEGAVSGVISEMGLGRHISLNRESLMILPAGVDKASGLRAAMRELGVAASETVGFGDAENDLPFLAICGLSVAVGNALAPVKASAGVVAAATHGDGVAEVVTRLLEGWDGPETA